METHATQLKPFIPSGADFAGALRFFKALGFRENWQNEGIAELQAGSAIFLLQDFQHPEMQQNLMMYLTVTHLDTWYNDAIATGIFEQFPQANIQAPVEFPWGVREVHFRDPAGVCWHVAE